MPYILTRRCFQMWSVMAAMSYEKLRYAKKTAVGAKQTLKAVQKQEARTVFLAQDAESRITGPIKDACHEFGVPVVAAESMKDLGRACGIGVGCAAAALLDE